MKRELGIAYCGLACCLCEKEGCPGCRNEGCTGREWCKNFRECKEKEIDGCWECNDFPCSGGMLDKLKSRTFAKLILEFGEDQMMDWLERNEKAGIVYHEPNSIFGDYDKFDSEDQIRELVISGKKN